MSCEDRDDAQGVPSFECNALSEVGHVIGVVSGKGGVGKSFVCGSLAIELARAGKTVGILDADVTGPSIPRMFGMAGKQATTLGNLFLPTISAGGVKVMSANLLLANEDDPVLWRGPILAGAIQQFWSQTSWGKIDYLLVDMPPGTGDVALTVFQSLPVEGVVIVTSPQDLVSMIVGKAVNMAERMDVPVLGLVENMSYVKCPHCDEHIEVFGPSHLAETAEHYGVDVIGRLPIDASLAGACDTGVLEDKLPEGLLPDAVAAILDLPEHEATMPTNPNVAAQAGATPPHVGACPSEDDK